MAWMQSSAGARRERLHRSQENMENDRTVRAVARLCIISKLERRAGVVQWQYRSFPSFRYGFDSRRPLQILNELRRALSDVLLAFVRWGKKRGSSAAFRSRPKTHSETGSKIVAAVATHRASASKWVEAHLLSAIGPADELIMFIQLEIVKGRFTALGSSSITNRLLYH